MNKTILVVEDNRDDAELTADALLARSNLTTRVVIVENGAEALDYLFGAGRYAPAPPPLPQLMLLDLQLPKIGGLEVLRRVRAAARTERLPVVVILTSSKEGDDAARGLGASAYLCKPVNFAQFNRVLRQLGLYWRVLNDAASGPERSGQ